MHTKLIRNLCLALLAALLVACGGGQTTNPGAETGGTPTASASQQAPAEGDPDPEPTNNGAVDGDAGLVIYSARKEELMEPLVEAFEEETGIEVSLKTGKSAELQATIEQEKGKPRGDVFFTTDAGGAEKLREQGLLEAYKSPNAQKVPAEFKAQDGAWTGVIGRSRNIVYNTELLPAAQAPKSIFELTDPKYKDKVAIASIEEGSVRLWLAWLLTTKGEEFTRKYISDLKANGVKVLAENSDVARAVAQGELPLGVTNHYYYVIQKKEDPQAPLGLVYPDQGQGEAGTLVIPLAVAVLEGAEHEDAAKKFVDFALSAEGQRPLTTQENEFPLVPGVGLGEAQAEGVKAIDEIKRPTVDFKQLADAEDRVLELFTEELTAGE